MRRSSTPRRTTRERRHLWIAAVVIGLICAAVALPQAGAHTQAIEEWTYWSGDVCARGRAEANHSGGGGGIRSTVKSYRRDQVWGTSCALGFNRPPGYVTAKWQWLKWNGSSWALCTQSNWNYNDSTVSTYSIYWSYTTPKCGNGLYYTYGAGFVLNGSWLGGWLGSPSHSYPA